MIRRPQELGLYAAQKRLLIQVNARRPNSEGAGLGGHSAARLEQISAVPGKQRSDRLDRMRHEGHPLHPQTLLGRANIRRLETTEWQRRTSPRTIEVACARQR